VIKLASRQRASLLSILYSNISDQRRKESEANSPHVLGEEEALTQDARALLKKEE